MNFLRELLSWFFMTGTKNEATSQPVLVREGPAPVVEVPKPKIERRASPTFDFLKENPSDEFLVDLQSIRPLAEQFDRAREDLLKELQRLAPPKKRLFDIFRKTA